MRISLVTMVLLLVGCAGNPIYGDLYKPSDIPQGMAQIVVYKKGINATNNYAGAHAEVKVDGVKEGDLMESTYIVLNLSPGFHEIEVGVPFIERPYDASIMFGYQTIKKEFKANSTSYLNYEIVAEPKRSFTAFYGGVPAKDSHQKFKNVIFSEIDEANALDQLSSCRRLKSF